MLKSIWVRVGIIAVVLVGAFLLRPFFSGNAGDLNVGDCFDEPADVTATVTDVQHHPCTDPHDAEVIFVGNYAPAPSDYPADFKPFYEANCTPAFDAYTGLDFTTETTYDLAAYKPTTDGWSNGDRQVICYAVRDDGTKMTSSLKKS